MSQPSFEQTPVEVAAVRKADDLRRESKTDGPSLPPANSETTDDTQPVVEDVVRDEDAPAFGLFNVKESSEALQQ